MAMPADEQAQPEPIILGAALRYASRGLRVIPIHPGQKRPVGDDWQLRASADSEVIRRWWRTNPNYGVGICTGWYGDRCIFVVDVDDGVDKNGRIKEGSETLADLEAAYGPLPETVEGQSGGGGRHLFFWAPVEIHNDQAGLLGVDLDLRGVGGQVVAEPTIHPDTHRPYMWIDGHDPIVGKIAQAPAWLVQLLTARPTVEPRTERLTYDGPPRPGDRFAAAVTWPELLRQDGATFLGARQDRKSGTSYELWARPGEDHTSATLYYGGTDVLKVFTSNWPNLRQGETYTRFGYWTATRYGGDHSKAAGALARAQFEADITALVANTPPAAEPVDEPSDTAEAPPEPTLSRLRQNLHFGDAILRLPPVTWLVDGIIQADGIGAIYGKPKSFKSFIAIDLGLHIANGRPWRGIPVEQTRVLYIAAEGAPGVGTRVEAWCYEHQGKLDNIIWLTVAPDLFTRTDGHDEVAELGDIAADYGCGLVFVDTLARSIPGAEENSAKDIGTVVAHLDHIRTKAGCSTLLVHHAGKDAGKGMRGSSALHGAIDTGLAVEGDQQAVNMQLIDQKNAESGLSWWWKPTKLLSSVVLTSTAGPDASEVGTRDLNILKQLQLIDSGDGASTTSWRQSVLERGLCGETMFKERVAGLHAEGLIEKAGGSQRSPWRLTANGRQRLRDMV